MAIGRRGKAAGPGKTPARGAGGKGGGKAPAKPKVPRRQRLKNVTTAFSMTRKADPRMLPVVLAALLVPFVLLLSIGLVFGHPVYLGLIGFFLGMLAATAVFGRRVQRAAFAQVEGQTGAAFAALSQARGGWRVTPQPVQLNREQDLVFRAVGRPGVVLVAEGSPARTRGLIANEKRRLAKVVGDTPIYEVHVGSGEGQVPLAKLERYLMKLPRNIKPRTVNELFTRFTALDRQQNALPIPKGPMPAPGRMPRRPR